MKLSVPSWLTASTPIAGCLILALAAHSLLGKSESPPKDDFVAPPPVRTPATVNVNRTAVPSVAQSPTAPSFSVAPTDTEIFRARMFSEPFVPVGKATTSEGNAALAHAITTYLAQTDSEDVSVFQIFLADHPDSAWSASLELNLGLHYFASGYFTNAMAAYEAAWQHACNATDAHGRAIANRAIAELLQLHSRLGHADEVERLLTQVEGRSLSGPVTELVPNARARLWLMRNKVETSFRCGTNALDRILAHQGGTGGLYERMKRARATAQGMSLTQVWKLASEGGLNFQMAKRSAGAALIAPAVIHWRVGHFAALIEEVNGVIRVEDPTFGDPYTVTRAAIDAEASGYFLVPAGPLPAGWQTVSEMEGGTVWGKGNTWQNDPTHTRNYDKKIKDPCGGSGMAVANAMAMTCSLNLMDTPLGYAPPRGPAVNFVLTYNQREASQPSVFDYSNLGPKWTHDWLSFIDEIRGGSTGNYTYTPQVRLPGGGTEPYPASSPTANPDLIGPYTFSAQADSRAQLTKLDVNTYQQLNPDGSKLIYGFRTGAQGSRRYFLTQVMDPTGQALTLGYDASTRLVSVTDALGQVTTLSYELAADTLKITKVTDPFGRFATLAYDASDHLTGITDVLGLTSHFTYESTSDFITTLTTPYGVSTFAYGENGRDRWLTLTDPQGDTERLEFHDLTSNYPPAGPQPTGMTTTGSFYNYRNSFYWSKKANKEQPGDVNAAHAYHWMHTATNETSGSLESEKAAFENRVWYNYEGQTDPVYEGTSGRRTKVGRVLDDGTTQLYQYEYNTFGRVTKATDPVGRVTWSIYDSNGIDLLEVRQKTGPNPADYEVLSRFTYNSQHLPLTVMDAAGQVTTFTYNTAGQLLTVTNAKNETTTFTYDASGYLTAIDGPLPGSADSTTFTYDGYGRRRTVTDSEGYTVTTDYDAFNRPTVVTYPDGTYEQIVYDKLDAVKTRDRRGHWTQMQYNALGQLVTAKDPLGRITQYAWCKCGDLRQIVDSAGHSTTWLHDVQGRVTAKQYADGTTITYRYEDTTSRIKTVTDVKGQVANYQYFADNALKQVSYTSTPVTTPTVSYTYDTYYPRIATMTDGLGTTAYSYNPIPATPTLAAGRLSSIDGPWANDTIAYTYDELGRVLTRTINGSADSMSAVYDAMGRVSSTTNCLGTFNYAYVNATGRLDHVDYPNGQRTNYTYFGNLGDERLQQIQNLKAGGANLSTFGYTYDVEGIVQTWTQQADSDPVKTWSLGYDAVDQLVSAAISSGGTQLKNYYYSYSVAGNRTSEQIDNQVTAASHNLLNEVKTLAPTGPIRFEGGLNEPGTLTINGKTVPLNASNAFAAGVTLAPGVNTVTLVATDASNNTTTKNYQVTVADGQIRMPSYDLNGNLTDDDAGRTYDWDGANRPVRITQGSNVTEFMYDGMGRRVQEKLNSVVIKQWVWDGNAPVEERDSSNTVTKRFFGQGEQISGTSYFYTSDHLGSIRELTDATGAIRARYDYDPYGRVTKLSGDLETDFGFAGFYRHQSSGLWLTLYRAYDANLGRWLSRDPAEENGEINLYGYVENNPINSVDPFGLWPTGAYRSQNVHGNAITRALGSKLPAVDIAVLVQQQVIADEDQTAAGSYKHAMRSPSQTVAQASALANFYVRNQIERARQLEKQNCHEQALRSLANAIHTLQDSTSPMHNGFQQWDGDPHSWAAIQHGRGENYDPGAGSQLDQATSDALKYFSGAPMPQDFFIYHADSKPHN